MGPPAKKWKTTSQRRQRCHCQSKCCCFSSSLSIDFCLDECVREYVRSYVGCNTICTHTQAKLTFGQLLSLFLLLVVTSSSSCAYHYCLQLIHCFAFFYFLFCYSFRTALAVVVVVVVVFPCSPEKSPTPYSLLKSSSCELCRALPHLKNGSKG